MFKLQLQLECQANDFNVGDTVTWTPAYAGMNGLTFDVAGCVVLKVYANRILISVPQRSGGTVNRQVKPASIRKG